ncbi:site-specific tyrosine recombinase/integron integrase [Phocicoccus pinnipedialis]|uniref:Tyrosine recombinase XerC n=1 Tax=Phocicoccus pinnipedialis TaxID=110845 RepID=A0A6V7RHH7_9BACL|nr:site-specific tyrosine recombinase/integron integrase [Jeotgalicoccus pinnipedialis]MBP1939105.1 integrase/recombinase XerC [Jeotgalicoccus pinnipedialis]CAD2076793.1 Tyrosine recombinase XerC [Jeotgalicoccus pinnipedialis]
MSLEKQYLDLLTHQKRYSEHTVASYEKDLEIFNVFLSKEHLKLETFRYQDARNFLAFLYDQGLKKSSVSRKISCLRSFYNYLVKNSFVQTNPFLNVPFPKEEQHLPDFLFENQMNDLFESLDKDTKMYTRNKAILELFYATGIRSDELLTLSLGRIDLKMGIIKVTGKGKKDRLVPLNEHATEALKEYIDMFKDKIIEHDALWLNHNLRPLTDRGLRYIVNDLMKKSAIQSGLHPHALRHTFATHMLNSGADIRAVQELLGHESLSTTQKYTHLSREQLRREYLNAHPSNRRDD